MHQKILQILNENKPTGNSYYVYDVDKLLFSNVPKIYYNRQYKKYTPIKPNADVNAALLKIKTIIADYHKNIEQFTLNNCFNNSKNIFNHLQQNYSNFSSTKIVYGFVERQCQKGVTIGNEILNNDIIVHDWHVWNYINNFLVDITLLNSGSTINIDEIPMWDNVEKFTFINPPSDTNYFGLEFDDYNKFEKDFRNTFSV